MPSITVGAFIFIDNKAFSVFLTILAETVTSESPIVDDLSLRLSSRVTSPALTVTSLITSDSYETKESLRL